MKVLWYTNKQPNYTKKDFWYERIQFGGTNKGYLYYLDKNMWLPHTFTRIADEDFLNIIERLKAIEQRRYQIGYFTIRTFDTFDEFMEVFYTRLL